MAKKKYVKYLIALWSVFVLLIGGVVLFFAAISWGYFGDMPTFEELENPKSNLASEIYSADQVLIGKYYVENRSNTHYSNLSPHLVNALVAAEDIRFRNHSGIDLKSLFRVAYGVIIGDHKGGGSTITQQLAKNLFPRDYNLSTSELVMRKFKEWITAVKLERNYSKNEIISMYFNTVPFGSQSFGIKSAARTYFNKTPMELKVEEAAMLVGVVNAPTRYSPILNPEASLKRRNVVLTQMARYDYISEAVKDSLVNVPIDMSEYNVMSHKTGIARYFREYIR
jgi:penicillin-binding protein 1A